jgi:formylglycine-generating enzyme required for sulfatase activity
MIAVAPVVLMRNVQDMMKAHLRHALILFVSITVPVVASPVVAQSQAAEVWEELPIQVEADILMDRITRALELRQYDQVLRGMEKYRKLEKEGAKLPVRLLFAEAEAANALKDVPGAQSALSEYLQRAQRDDPFYPDALRMYTALEVEAARLQEQQREEERLRAEKQREEERALLIESLVNDMVAIPGGKFRMGDIGRSGDPAEQPVRTVKVAPFLLGRHEITFAQFDMFTEATDRPLVDDKGWGRGDHPVMNVSWADVQAFITWLSEQTGLLFRLPSEAEWELAARGSEKIGLKANYWWADQFSPDFANSMGVSGKDRWSNTAPVGSFPPNPYGLFDMHGNVREWVADCWYPSYSDAGDGSAPRMDGDCSRRILRGGAWNLGPASLRSSKRDWDDQGYRFPDRGFRLARDQ